MAVRDDEAFLAFAADSDNWNYGPVLDIAMRYGDPADFRRAWDAVWSEAALGPFSDHALTTPAEKPESPSAVDAAGKVIVTHGALEVDGHLLGVKCGSLVLGQHPGFTLNVWAPPRFAERVLPGWGEEAHEGPRPRRFFRSLLAMLRRIREKAPFEAAIACDEQCVPSDFFGNWPRGTILVEPGFAHGEGPDVVDVALAD